MTYSQAVTIYPASLSSLGYVLTVHHMYFLVSFLFLPSRDMGNWTAFLGKNLQCWHLVMCVHFYTMFFLEGLDKNSCFKKKWTLLHCWWECKLIQPLWRTVWRFLKKLKIELPYDPVIPLLGIYPEKTIIQKDICTPMFTAALFTIARSWKQPKCPSTDKWIKKMWYIYTMEYYSAIKRNEIGSFVEMWMDLESVIQSEVSQKEKNKHQILMHICGI